MYKVIFVDAGHGKSNGRPDPGTTYQNITERNLVVKIAKALLAKFGNKGIGIGIDEDLDLDEKISKINSICKVQKLDSNNSLLISIHVDYYQAKSGVAAYHFGGSSVSRKYAQSILEGISERTYKPLRWNKPDTDSRHGSLGIIRLTIPLAMLLESGSIKNDQEFLQNPDLLVQCLYEAINEFAGWNMGTPTLNDATDLVSSVWKDIDSIYVIDKSLAKKMQDKLHQANNIIRSFIKPL